MTDRRTDRRTDHSSTDRSTDLRTDPSHLDPKDAERVELLPAQGRGAAGADEADAADEAPWRDVVCLSHLRWSFVFQRPNHLMLRCARERRVFFVEEPLFDDGPTRMETHSPVDAVGLTVCTPHLRRGTTAAAAEHQQALLLHDLAERVALGAHLQWFYSPMALPWVNELPAALTVYDCMDELSAFLGAPPELMGRERALLQKADVVFTGGHSIYASKRALHRDVHAFPSSVDAGHFARARSAQPEPPDQRHIAGPRLGFFGVVDERMDLDLLARLADERPGYQVIIVGPVVKIDPRSLPQRPNLHFLGQKTYDELPAYLAGWDVALMPFALNEATRFISPTKTLEYLAAHKPVVSTAIRDVVSPWGERQLVRIADAAGFAAAVDDALAEDPAPRAARCEQALAQTSWDRTFDAMWAQVQRVARTARSARSARSAASATPARPPRTDAASTEVIPCSTR